MARYQLNGRKCSFERLEDRRVLAGNVIATISDGNLIVKGDNADNQIMIAISAAGVVTITSPTTPTNPVSAVTTVNSATATGAGVSIPGTFSGRIELNLKGGNDKVTLVGPITAKEIESENTEDLSNTGTLTVNGDFKVKDVKTFDLTTTTVNGKTEIDGVDGGDTVSLVGTFNGPLDIELGDSANTNFVSLGVTVTGKTKIEGGRGKDDIGIGFSTLASIEVDLGKGDDSIELLGTAVSGKAQIETGDGNDTVTITSNFIIILGVKIFFPPDPTFGSLDIDLGKGNDKLAITHTTVTRKTDLDGGRGGDTFDTTGNVNVFTGGLKRKRFETLIP